MNLKNKILLATTLLLVTITAFATDINVTCFKDYGSLELKDTLTKKVKLDSSSNDIFFMQWENLVPYKVFSEDKRLSIPFKVITVSSWNNLNIKYINDGNYSTFYSFDDLLDKNKSITLDFGTKLAELDFKAEFDITHKWPVIFSISDDNIVYNQVNEYNLSNFSFRYLKINFPNYKDDVTINKTLINEINFTKKDFTTYLVNPIDTTKVSIYRGYDCNFDSIKDTLTKYMKLINNSKFSIDANTSEFTIKFEPNKAYNTDFDNDGITNDKDNCKYIANTNQVDIDWDLVWDACDYDNTSKNPLDFDIDKDGVGDSVDNCKYIYNPDQKDSNWDNTWDVCSDDDNDGIMWNIDNCPNISNPDQKDVNVNNIWDACEFDKDKDGIFDSIDNCPNIANSDQADSDNNWVWNVCEDSDSDGIINFKDNCSYKYNPEQYDVDKDGKWDLCDLKDDRYIESNRWFFVWLLIFIVTVFWVGIYTMIRKLRWY